MNKQFWYEKGKFYKLHETNDGKEDKSKLVLLGTNFLTFMFMINIIDNFNHMNELYNSTFFSV